MGVKKVIFAIAFAIFFHHGPIGSVGSVKTFSDYSKVVRIGGKTAAEETAAQKSNLTSTPALDNATEEIEYDDFDDLPEEERSLDQPQTSNDMMKFVSGLVSLLALMYKFNDRIDSAPAEESTHADSAYLAKRETGQNLQQAQARFDFPQKKFKKNQKENSMDQQYPSAENYPPYNPQSANGAETYGNDDRRITSYDVYEGGTSLGDQNGNLLTQQSYFPHETAKPGQQNSYDSTEDDRTSWNVQNLHPVYRPWMSNPPTGDRPSNLDSYQSWQLEGDSKDPNGEYPDPENFPSDDPIHQHDFEDAHHHHLAGPRPGHHEVEHPADEDRVSKKPYSYYFLGRKLWYVPLLFSVYFIVYIGSLILKSVARHKIQFPEKLWDLHGDVYGHGKHRKHRKIDEITENYENALEKVKNKFM